MREDSARAEAKPPRPKGEIVDSAPPAIMMSASPYSIKRPAAPMQCRPVVHAVTIARFGPLSPYLIDKCPEIMFMIEAGTKNGLILRGPRFVSSACVSSIIGKPPMPEPTMTPIRSALVSVTSKPLSCIACIPAAIP